MRAGCVYVVDVGNRDEWKFRTRKSRRKDTSSN
jgi:hypothetical protein